MKLRVVYRVELGDRLVEAVYRALVPEMSMLPETCRGEVNTFQKTLVLLFECSSLSKVRALNNNLIGLLALLLRIVGELENVRDSTGERFTTRSSAINNSVSDSQRTLY